MDEKKLDDLACQQRREYYCKWRAEHKDDIRRHNRDYWRRKAEKQLAKEKEEQHNG